MVTVDKAVVARLTTPEGHFEVLVDCEKALQFKAGKTVSMGDLLAVDEVFKDASKGMKASETALTKVFGTTDTDEVAKQIIKKGEVQLTAEHRKNELDLKRRRIIETIHRNCVDPRTHLPHPLTRLENAFVEGKIRIDEIQPVERQVQEIIKKLQPILPMRFETHEISIKMAPQHAAKCHQPLRQYGKVLQEEWDNAGNLLVVVEIPAGLQQELIDKLNALTKGDIDLKVLNTK
ncbi:MAG: ribosome assembly factor SBDS [Nanoarchaeota archaeon]|nr:ribosome assembly factor SBDS [Nanoarchaeota archaeon]